MAQVQLDEVSDLDVQIANEHVLLGLGVGHTVREGEIYQDHPYSPASLVLPSLARMLYSLPLNCKFKFVIYYVDLAHAGSSAVQKMDLLKIVPFSLGVYIFGPASRDQEFASLIPRLFHYPVFDHKQSKWEGLGNAARTMLYLQLC